MTPTVPPPVFADILGYGTYRGVVALGASHDGFGKGNDVSVAQCEAVFSGCSKDILSNNFCKIVALSDDRAADTT